MRHIVRLQPYHLGTFDLFAARNTFDELYIRQHRLDGFQPGRMPAEHHMLLLGMVRECGVLFMAGLLLPCIIGQSENQLTQVVEFLLFYGPIIRLLLYQTTPSLFCTAPLSAAHSLSAAFRVPSHIPCIVLRETRYCP